MGIRTKSILGFSSFLLTEFLIFYCWIVTNVFGIWYWYSESLILSCTLYAVFNSVLFMGWISHIASSFQDPGIITRETEISERIKRTC